MRSPQLAVVTAVAAAALALGPLPGHAQRTPGGPETVAGAASTAEADTTALEGAAGTAAPYAAGLPARAAPPRTLRAYWHVFIAFAIVWLLLFGYAISVGRRFARLEDEVRRLGRPPV